MQNYRYILAIALTLAVILGWNYIAEPLGLIPPKEVTQNANNSQTNASAPVLVTEQGVQSSNSSAQPLQLTQVPELPKGRLIEVKTPLYSAQFNATGGILTSFSLNKYSQTLEDKSPFAMVTEQAAVTAPLGLLLNESPTWIIGEWDSKSESLDLAGSSQGMISFVWEYSGIRLVRELHFKADDYLIEEKIRLENLGSQAVSFSMGYTMKTAALNNPDEKYNATEIGYLSPSDSFNHEADLEDLNIGLQEEAVRWGSIQSNFFMAAAIPSGETSMKAQFKDGVYRVALNTPQLTLNTTQPLELSSKYYLGPKKKDTLEVANADLDAAMYKYFKFIAEPMIMFLSFLYKYLGNYGLAIIALTLIIKVILWPLSRKSYKSMEKMRQLQPMIKKIQEKHKDDKQQASAETMRLYKTYKVNPAGGCLPMLMQIPIFIGLYQGLLNAVELRHAPFITYLPFTHKIWLADLSAMDPFYITPIVMGASMFLTQKMSPPMGDPTQAKVMMFMPVIFTFLFINFPSGLVVYWLVNNVFSLGQQWFTMRKKKAKPQSATTETIDVTAEADTARPVAKTATKKTKKKTESPS